MQETSRPAGIDEEPSVDLEAAIVSDSFNHDFRWLHRDCVELDLVEIDGPLGFRLSHERVIEVRPVPVGIADLVMRAGRDEKLMGVVVPIVECLAKPVEKERETALEADGDVRPGSLPGAPLRERADLGQLISVRELLEQQIRQRRRGFADRKPWMATPFEQHHPLPSSSQAKSREGSRKARANDGDIGLDAFARLKRRATGMCRGGGHDGSGGGLCRAKAPRYTKEDFILRLRTRCKQSGGGP